jgi:pyrroloquinoline quinone biosynthesis protein B
VHVLLLGSAAGGGFPQWNCWCPGCRAARTHPSLAVPRSQSSAAISADGARWFLLNASPDVRDQLRWIDGHPSASAVRYVPIEAVVLTDAELDHTLGLALLREGGHMTVYATEAVGAIIEHDSRILATTRAFSQVPMTTLAVNRTTRLLYRDASPSGLSVEPFEVPAGPPRFASHDGAGHTVGLIIREEASGRVCAFVPGCGGLDASLLQRLAASDALLFDGTFWQDDELIALGVGTRTARQLDHLPISGPDGSLARLADLPCRHRVYTHINNTNPILLEQSPQRETVTRAGVTVGFDGWRVEV